MSTIDRAAAQTPAASERRGGSVAAIVAGRRSRHRRHAVATIVLGAMLVVLFAVALMIGNTFYPLDEVIRVIVGETVPGASFTVGELRLPRAVLAILAGFAFGIAGVSFQTLLRNPLASPDIIGISNGAGAVGDADDVGRRERVAEQRLERDARDAEREPGEDREHRAGQPQLTHRERRPRNRLAHDDADHLVERIERVADHQGDSEQHHEHRAENDGRDCVASVS
mgnify:CR=1 FL=1